MSDSKPTLLWLRRDLRLSDHPAWAAALKAGGPVIPVFIHDDTVASLGAAPKWRLGLGLGKLAETLDEKGSRLILRKGEALQVLRDLIEETGAGAVHWSRLYDPDAIERDKAVKSALKEDGIDAVSHAGHLMFEPWTVETKDGGYYKVYTPMWRAVKDRDVAEPLKAPTDLRPPESWPGTDDLKDWRMGAAMDRGADIVLPYQTIGEEAAQDRLAWFIDDPINDYNDARDKPAVNGTSGLSENLSLGEISPAQCWHAGMRKLNMGSKGAEAWLKELVWREFAYHLIYHTPQIATRNWREKWDEFPWNEDGDTPEVMAWKQGRTGIKFVDAAMREMYVTGRMHNRARMIVASYLTKHLMTHWRVGQAWFDDHLTDWDIASNAMGWQWAAGCGPDASPYFRIFNPETQLEKFDKKGNYTRAWIVEGQDEPSESALSYFDAIPRSWDIGPDDAYPEPVVGLSEGRQRALDAYKGRSF
ncbi:deoxyribodipyrimidine photo-lyase [Roseovarius nanhaiticus]|uniref:Deoxyribodipyrimidine photo-lyase n=1 Tax=Roseovarius nanhaiticus TaxID=573024 RepID=A0A1N7GVC5_9RHOB|nr:deoxyribodipyrimidine photo-lyase [Roseovarius nanhaiticus]SEL31516.1 deoxyribodipyrimidine photo-lyase [Roseovarius nanhaiticus]SIS16490.1 deoxyribodipyrimidine photo-lyase [Roseovarius nanhaiticus]